MIEENGNDKNRNNKKLYYEYSYILESLSKESSEILTQEKEKISGEESLEDAVTTMSSIDRLYNQNYYDTYMELINNAPIFLFKKKVERIIPYLLGLGLKEDEIIELLCTSFDKCIELSEKAKDSTPINSDEYFKIASRCKEQIKNGNISPESYKVRVKRIMKEHEDLLRRLK